jgi:hypothetical protein
MHRRVLAGGSWNVAAPSEEASIERKKGELEAKVRVSVTIRGTPLNAFALKPKLALWTLPSPIAACFNTVCERSLYSSRYALLRAVGMQ